MSAVRRIYELIGVEGLSIYAARARLEREGHAPPEASRWNRHAVRAVILDDCYQPHTNSELAALVEEGLLAPDVFARLDKERSYGVAWFNRTKRTRTKEPDAQNGGYRKRSRTVDRPRSEWIAVPVADAGVPCEWVDAARKSIEGNRVPSRAGGRFAELSGGVLFCSGCGRRMIVYTTHAGRNRKIYRYYVCPARRAMGDKDCPAPVRSVNADRIEAAVWEAVSAATREATREDVIRVHFDSPADITNRIAEDIALTGRLADRLEKLESRRSEYIDMAADHVITRDDLKGKLSELEHERQIIRQQMSQISGAQEARRRLLSQRDALVDHIRSTIRFQRPEERTPEDRHKLYLDTGLRVELDDEGNPVISGAFGLFSKSERHQHGGAH